MSRARIATLGLCVLVVACAGKKPPTHLPERTRIAALVNGEPIPVSRVDNRMFNERGMAEICAQHRLQCTPERLRRLRQQLRLPTVDLLVDEVLERQEAKRLGITVDEHEVAMALALDVPPALGLKGWPADEVAAFHRARVTERKRDAAILLPRVKLTDTLLQAEYRTFVAEWWRSSVAAQCIHLSVPTPEARNQIADRAYTLYERAQRGEDFCELVKQYGDADLQEDCGRIHNVHELWLESLKDGEVATPRATVNGYKIIRRNGASPPSFEAAQTIVSERATEREIARIHPEWLARLRSSARTQYFVDTIFHN